MRVLCVSDMTVHGLGQDLHCDQFGLLDFIISCGDLPPEYLKFLRGAFKAPLYYVRGNHDIRYNDTPPEGCTNLHGKILRHGRLRIAGFEGSRWYNGGPAQYTEAQMRWMVWRLRPRIWLNKGVDLLVTHAPPRFIHDSEDNCHRGFRIYRRLIDWYAPRYFLHGHIHEHFAHMDQRISLEGRTQVINCFGSHLLDIDE